MDFNLTEDQLIICESIKELCRKKLNENTFEDDEKSNFPLKKWKICGEFGIQGLPIPEEYGGLDQDLLTTALAIRSLGCGCKDEGLVFSICAHMLTCVIPIWQFGSEEQKKKFLPLVASGEMIGGNGITEADAGSDTSAIRTKVTKEDGYYIIDGSKIFVTNGPVADLLIIYAKHPQGMKMLDISAFIIEQETEGFNIGQVFRKMGLRTAPLSEVILDKCKVPAGSLLGRERLGMKVFNHSMLWERIVMGAYHIGSMQQQYDLVLEYANQRKQFGQKIIRFQNIADKLIEMKMRIQLAELMLYKVCWNYDNNKTNLTEAAMLKLLTSEYKVKNSLDSVQIFGAYGYLKESQVEKQLRDSIASKIYSGTTEIQRKIISENMGEST